MKRKTNFQISPREGKGEKENHDLRRLPEEESDPEKRKPLFCGGEGGKGVGALQSAKGEEPVHRHRTSTRGRGKGQSNRERSGGEGGPMKRGGSSFRFS